ncbi:IS4 family transposase, partial [Candidatus Magnetaquicoccus inordinatus]|uniref:IS4 family transposase n=1 Tax=Candidatus Magnetaquicoccus inordinatus TaxID=2496818 RepID=UPI00102B6429
MNTNTVVLDENWEFLRSLFPSGWEELARETRAILQYKGDVKSVSDWMRIFLIHLAGGYSLEETVTRAKMAKMGSISDVALMKRLQNSGEWFHRMGLQLIAERDIQLPTLAGFNLKLIDASVIKEPGKTGSEWRLHYALTVPELRCDHFELTPVKGTGTGENFIRFAVAPGDCLMGDRAYATVRNIEYVHKNHGNIIVRMSHTSLPLYVSNCQRFDLLGKLESLTKPGQTSEWQVEVHGNEGIIPGRLCVVRKDEEAIRKALKRLHRRGQKSGSKVQDETKEFAKYVMVFTTISK